MVNIIHYAGLSEDIIIDLNQIVFNNCNGYFSGACL